MKLNDLIVAAQNQADEVVDKPDLLWSLAEWTEYANDAEREACIRANLLLDQTSSMAVLAVSSGKATYGLNEKVLIVKRA